MGRRSFNQLSRKMLHIIMTLLIYGGKTESTKCPESCTCIQTLVLPVNNSRGPVIFDEDNITITSFAQHLHSYKNILSSVGLNEAEYNSEMFESNTNKSLSRNQTRSVKCAKNLKENVRNIFAHGFSPEPVKSDDDKEIRTKRNLKVSGNITEKSPVKVDGAEKAEALNENGSEKEALTETDFEAGGNKEIFTYQITCNGLRDSESLRLRNFPNLTTDVIIRRTYFRSFNAFQQILRESSVKLARLTHLSITDSVINQKSNKKYSTGSKLTYKVGVKANGESGNRNKEFLPFASLQNPKLRSKTEPELTAKGKCKNLQVLNLVNNSITFLPREVFRPFENLQILNLSTNLIEFVDNELFGALVNLLHLDIHDNRLHSLNELMFKNLTKLVFLDVSQNSISNIAPSTFQYLLSLNILNLANNPLFKMEEAIILLGSGRGLQIIDVSKTGMKQIPGTLERSVRVLNLMGNHLLSIRCGDLDSYFLLSYLNLRDNKISYVEDDALGRLEFLINLQISFNNLFQIPKSLPNNLEILNLSYNNIQNITNSDFVNLSLLKELAISYNQISSIESDAFNNLIRLKTLDLSRNPILILPNIYSLARLTNLNLSYFTNIPGSFSIKYKQFPVQSPENIRQLNLESSPVLTKIFLDDTKTLEAFQNLAVLDIRFSNLTTIRKDIFSLLPNLKTIKVQGNPWHCGKEILILSEWLRNHRSEEDADSRGEEYETNAAHCSTPPHLYKTTLITLEERNFEDDQDKRDNQLMSRNKTSHDDDEFKGKNLVKVGDSIISRPKNFSGENWRKLAKFSEKKNSIVKEVQKSESREYNNNNNNNNNNNSNNNDEGGGGGGDNVEQSLNQDKKENPEGENCCGKSPGKVDVEKFEKNSSASTQERVLTEGGDSRAGNGSLAVVRENDSKVNASVEAGSLFALKKAQVPHRTLKKAEAVTANDAIFLKKEYNNSHISFFILSSIGLVVMATLTFTSVYFSRARRNQNYQRQNQDIEVCSISSISNELW